MTGMHPDYTKVWDMPQQMRERNPDILMLPQHFAANGYSTQGIGKMYDQHCVDEQFDAPSWTAPYYTPKKKYFTSGTGLPAVGRSQN